MDIAISRQIDAGHEILFMLCRLSNARGDCIPEENRMRVAAAHFLGIPALSSLRPALKALTELEESVLSAVHVDDERLSRLFAAPASELQPAFYLYHGMREGLTANQCAREILLSLQEKEEISPSPEGIALDAFVRDAMQMGFDRDYVLNLTQMLACWDQEKAWLCALLDSAYPAFDKKRASVQPLVEAWADALNERLPQIRQTGEVCSLLRLQPGSIRTAFVPALIGFHSVRLSLPGRGGTQIIRYGVLLDAISAAVPGVQDSQLITRLRALGDKRRLKIIRALVKRPCYAGEIAELTRLSPATVSYHMTELLNAQLVSAEEAGNRVLYRLSEAGLRALISDLSTLLN